MTILVIIGVAKAIQNYRNSLTFVIRQEKEFEDTKGVIRIRKSNKDRRHSGQKKKGISTHNNLQNIHIKLKIRLT